MDDIGNLTRRSRCVAAQYAALAGLIEARIRRPSRVERALLLIIVLVFITACMHWYRATAKAQSQTECAATGYVTFLGTKMKCRFRGVE